MSLQENCEIQSVNLLSCTATRAKEGTQFREPFSVKPVLSNVAPMLQGDNFVVEVSVEYTAWDSSEPPERMFSVNCTFEASYRIRDGHSPTKDEVVSFSRGTAVFNCWPYAREFLRDITARMGHPALPLLRIVPKKPLPEQQQSLPLEQKLLDEPATMDETDD
jgi:preprotein translocase subunit SecB